ncbi:ABC transporter ATP-binding protein [Paenibacillus sp. y28]|uniref:ABC transporter ATP-binding protein n=1 Tax=Paenibacillus sp. y28 TaxID=3129110 RepID=UPI00301AB688
MSVLLTAERLVKSYRTLKQTVSAVSNVSFQIGAGECLGLVGESGSGKSTVARLLLGLEQPDGGDIRLNGISMIGMKGPSLRFIRQHIQVVFQDPAASLNDRLPVWRSVMEPLDNFPDVVPPFLMEVRHSRRETAARLMEMVGLRREYMDFYPHQLSGGQKQRVSIARGISLRPKLLICDEPTSSLDVMMQAQILQLLKQLQQELGMSYLFISHDIAAVQQMSNRILVMRGGQILDHFFSDHLWSQERHEYTRLLLAATHEASY